MPRPPERVARSCSNHSGDSFTLHDRRCCFEFSCVVNCGQLHPLGLAIVYSCLSWHCSLADVPPIFQHRFRNSKHTTVFIRATHVGIAKLWHQNAAAILLDTMLPHVGGAPTAPAFRVTGDSNIYVVVNGLLAKHRYLVRDSLWVFDHHCCIDHGAIVPSGGCVIHLLRAQPLADATHIVGVRSAIPLTEG